MATFKPVITKRKSARGRIIGYEATLNGFQSCGETKQEAEADLASLLEATGKDQDPILVRCGGYTAMLWFRATQGQYNYQIISGPDRDANELAFINGQSCGPQLGSQLQARQDVIRHLADLSPMTADELDQSGEIDCLTDDMKNDLQRKEQWQTRKMELTALGFNDHESDMIIAGFATEESILSRRQTV